MRNIVGRFGDLTCSESEEEVNNVKSLGHTDVGHFSIRKTQLRKKNCNTDLEEVLLLFRVIWYPTWLCQPLNWMRHFLQRASQ
jgi:hypothetical protein